MTEDVHAWLAATLKADVALKVDLGDPPRIFDTVPVRRVLPCLIIGEFETSDWQTSDEDGQAVIASLAAFSRTQNRRQLYRICDRIRELVGTAGGAIGQTRIVLATHVASAFAHDRDQRAFRASMHFRILCEPVA